MSDREERESLWVCGCGLLGCVCVCMQRTWDNRTSVKRSAKKKTIIIIAHRLTTLKDCDEIIILELGGIAARGCYDDLMAENALFARMANESGERR